GGQVFGHVLRADRRRIEIEGRFGERSLPWSRVRRLFPRREASPLQQTAGEHVRIWLRNGVGADVDELEGVVRALDGSRLTLRHAVLGDLDLDRGRLQRIRLQVPE